VTREEEFTRVQAELQTITRDRAHIEVGPGFRQNYKPIPGTGHI